MTPSPRGRVLRTIHLSNVYTLADGSVVKVTASGHGIIVHLRAKVPGMKPSDARRSFVRAAMKLGVILDVCETSQGVYSQAGKVIVEGLPSAYQAVGNVEALEEIIKHVAVEKWHFALNVPLPRASEGSGQKKPRTATGSAFGKPATVRGTASEIAKATASKVKKLSKEE